MAQRRIIRPGQPEQPSADGGVGHSTDNRSFNISAAWTQRTQRDGPGYFFNRRPTVELKGARLPALINPAPMNLRETRQDEDKPIELDLDEPEEAFFLREDEHGSLRLHTRLDGIAVTMGVTSITNGFVRSAAAVSPRDGPSRLWRSAAWVAALALISAGVVGAMSFGIFDRSAPPLRSAQVSRQAAIAPAPPEPGPDLTAPLPTTRAKPVPRPASRPEPRSASDDAVESIPRARRIVQRPDELPSEAFPDPVTFTATSDAARDPYAGRVAKRLTGEALESAIEADRLATRERNLRQLDDDRTADVRGDENSRRRPPEP